MRLSGKTAIVTGGASGIGRAICQQFVDQGCAAVGIFDIDEAGARETIALMGDAGKVCTAYKVDIADYANVQAGVTAFVQDAGGSPDILVNNVGWDLPILFLDTEPDFWDKLIGINLRGPMNMCHVVLRLMVDAGKGGRVINIASDAGRLGAGHEAVYSACKGGVITFTKSLAREHARHNILCNVVSPGSTNTAGYRNVKDKTANPDLFEQKMVRQTPLRRLGEPGECASMVSFLASDEASFIHGQTISVSGGLTMLG
ncbi:MAG: 3-oxoacyl-[acyl-carrier-protein] reductase FabG [Pseudomonadota bacterium]